MSEKSESSKTAKSGASRKKVNFTKSTETFNTILDAAHQILITEGFGQTTIRSICKKSGHGVGTVYLYFPNIESIFEALLRREFYSLTRDLQTHILPRLPQSPEKLLNETFLFILNRQYLKNYMELFSNISIAQGNQTGASMMGLILDSLSLQIKERLKVQISEELLKTKTLTIFLALRGFLTFDFENLKSIGMSGVFTSKESYALWLTNFTLDFLRNEKL